jgi:hypothetical protein
MGTSFVAWYTPHSAMLGSGGGGGNGYSPLCSGAVEYNDGGPGGGAIIIKSGAGGTRVGCNAQVFSSAPPPPPHTHTHHSLNLAPSTSRAPRRLCPTAARATHKLVRHNTIGGFPTTPRTVQVVADPAVPSSSSPTVLSITDQARSLLTVAHAVQTRAGDQGHTSRVGMARTVVFTSALLRRLVRWHTPLQ